MMIEHKISYVDHRTANYAFTNVNFNSKYAAGFTASSMLTVRTTPQ